MSTPPANPKTYDEDDDDDDEPDYNPGEDEEEDDEDDDDGDNLHEDGVHANGIPNFLQGSLYKDKDGKVVYSDDGEDFTIQSYHPTPSWSPEAPVTIKPILCSAVLGELDDLEVELRILETSLEEVKKDPFTVKLLSSQEDQAKETSVDAKKAGTEEDGDSKRPADPDAKLPASKATGVSVSDEERVFTVEGHLTEPQHGKYITFHGAFRQPQASNVKDRVFLICHTKLSEVSKRSPSSPTKSPPVVAAAAASSTRRKRGRSRGDEDDDDDVDNDGGVAYDELFDLHDDANLSVEALRQKYYGGGLQASAEAGGSENAGKKKAKLSSTALATPVAKGIVEGGTGSDDEDDDDDIGF